MFDWLKKFLWRRIKPAVINSFDLNVDTIHRGNSQIVILVELSIFGEKVLSENIKF